MNTKKILLLTLSAAFVVPTLWVLFSIGPASSGPSGIFIALPLYIVALSSFAFSVMFLVLAFVQKKQDLGGGANPNGASTKLHSSMNPLVTLTIGIAISLVALGLDFPLSLLGYFSGGLFLVIGIAGIVGNFFGKQ